MGKETTRLRRTFTPQFKKDAVRLVVEEGKSLTEVAAHEQTKAATAHRTSPRNLSVGMVMVAGTEARDRLERAHMGFSGF